MSQEQMMALEARIDELLRDHQRLKRAQIAFDQERKAWEAERAELENKNQQARQRLEFVIARLKEFEQAT